VERAGPPAQPRLRCFRRMLSCRRPLLRPEGRRLPLTGRFSTPLVSRCRRVTSSLRANGWHLALAISQRRHSGCRLSQRLAAGLQASALREPCRRTLPGSSASAPTPTPGRARRAGTTPTPGRIWRARTTPTPQPQSHPARTAPRQPRSHLARTTPTPVASGAPAPHQPPNPGRIRRARTTPTPVASGAPAPHQPQRDPPRGPTVLSEALAILFDRSSMNAPEPGEEVAG
jgi:hypothetical protein